MITVDKQFVYANLVTAGYMTYDYFVQKYHVAGKDQTSILTLWHHIWGIAGSLSAVIAGYGLPGVAGMVLVVEISTIFLNYRSFYKKEEYHLLVPSVS